MNIALLLPFGLSTTLQSLARCLPVRWIKRSGSPAALSCPPQRSTSTTSGCTHTHANPALTSRADCSHLVHRPLRVVRVLEAGQPKSHSGRMLISGCMADVCAELDRLAAAETALS